MCPTAKNPRTNVTNLLKKFINDGPCFRHLNVQTVFYHVVGDAIDVVLAQLQDSAQKTGLGQFD